MKKLPIYYCDLNEGVEGILTMSFVESPAVEINWMEFSEEKPLYFSDDKKHIVTSVALRADFPIYRRRGDKEFYVIFTKDNIQKIVEKFFKDKRTSSVNLEHSVPADNCYLIESYFAKADNPFGVKEGSWICSYKIENSKVWELIENQKFNGFSVEGYLNLTEQDELEDYINKIID